MSPQGLEVPIFGFKSGAAALAQGARRLELNAAGSYAAGGTTPSLEELKSAMEYIKSTYPHVSVRVMIRPRGPPPAPERDFIYTDQEFAEMRNAITDFKNSGELRAGKGDGFVFGMLKPVGLSSESGRVAVDLERNAELVRLAEPFQCVFHRAFDDILGSGSGAHPKRDLFRKALNDLKDCGYHGVLTSGGPGNAPSNVDAVKDIIETSTGVIEVIVGGGVRSSNISSLAVAVMTRTPDKQPTVWFHSSCLTSGGGSEVVSQDEVQAISQRLESIKLNSS